MAVKTTMEIIDFLDNTDKDYSIHATNLDLNDVELISSDNVYRYIIRKYADRKYSLILGIPSNNETMNTEFHNDFRLWLLNRKRNIDRMYQTLYDYNYVPIENYNRTETETEQIEDNFAHGHVISDEGSNTTYYGKTETMGGSDRTTYGKVDSLTGTDTTATTETIVEDKSDHHTGTETEIKSGSEITTNEKSAFNSPSSYTPDTKTTLQYNGVGKETTFNDTHTIDDDRERSETETVTHNTAETLSGSDSVSYGKTDTLSGHDEVESANVSTHSGTDTDNKESERNMHAFGNIGVTTNQKMVTEEMEVRKIALAEMLINNFIDDYTFYS